MLPGDTDRLRERNDAPLRRRRSWEDRSDIAATEMPRRPRGLPLRGWRRYQGTVDGLRSPYLLTVHSFTVPS
jgi:hypothetical protein